MTLKITYKNKAVETHIAVVQIIQKKDHSGKNTGILVESFDRSFVLEQPRATENRGVEKMELFFNTINT